MNFELALYDLTLLVVGVVNIAMATGLLMNNYTYRHYPVYHRSRMLTAVFFAVFGIGLILHYHYHWRQTFPPLATALSLTYFHIAGVAVTWSHTSLLNPRYLSRRVAARDIAFLAIAIPTYWLTAMFNVQCSMFNVPGSMFIFLLHAVWMTYDFYTAYYRIRHRLRGIQSSTQHARCFRWMLLSCHLIIAFGIGSIVFTILLPTAIWPYTVLLCVGGMVFAYIYYSISEYGAVIDYATNVAEDVGS